MGILLSCGFHFSEEPQHRRAPSRFHGELCEGPLLGPRKVSKGIDGVRGAVRSQRPEHPCRVLTAVLPGAAAEESPVLPTGACWSFGGARHTELLPQHTHTHGGPVGKILILLSSWVHISIFLRQSSISGTQLMHLGVRELGKMLGCDKKVGPSDGSSFRLLSHCSATGIALTGCYIALLCITEPSDLRLIYFQTQ